MDSGYPPSYDFSQQNSSLSSSEQFLPHHVFFDHSESPTSTQSPEFSNNSDSPHFSFDLPYLVPQEASPAPLVDCSIFDMSVDISFGILPPRPACSRAFAQGRIPRPRNAFMLFRSAFHRERRVTQSVEKDHRHISRIIGICWSGLPEAEKDMWRQRAELEKQQHALAYPNYRFKPTPRTKQPVKRNVKRNTPQEIERCQRIAKLIRDGKSGEELTHAVENMEGGPSSGSNKGGTVSGSQEKRKPRKQKALHPIHRLVPQFHQVQPYEPQTPPVYEVSNDPPPFRSPLLPPVDLPRLNPKRSYSGMAMETPSQTLQATAQHHTSNALYFPQIYATQEDVPRESQRSLRYRQRLQNQLQQEHRAFEWPVKDLNLTTSYEDPTYKHHYVVPDMSQCANYATFSPGRAVHDSYPPEGGFVPGAVDWNTYYRVDSDRAFADAVVPAPAAYDPWSKSDDSVSPVHSDSPITPL